MVAMLRSINVAGHNKISMAALRGLVGDLGFDEVRTYLQSGNVIFGSSIGPPAVAANIEKALRNELGLAVAVIVRTAAELSEVVAANPFVADGSDQSILHVTFLAAEGGPARPPPVIGSPAGDHYRLVGREVYLQCPSGYGRTKLHNAFWERRLGTVATTRNFRTVTKLAELAELAEG
jgi:uncharacterized protein (DUF1697 family)